MEEDRDPLMDFLPEDREGMAVQSGALRGLREDRPAGRLLRVPPPHPGCGHSLPGTVARARRAGHVPGSARCGPRDASGGCHGRQGARQDRFPVGDPPPGPRSVPAVRPFQPGGDRRPGRGRVLHTVPGRRGGPSGWRPGPFGRGWHRPRRGCRRVRSGAREHRTIAPAGIGRRTPQPTSGGAEPAPSGRRVRLAGRHRPGRRVRCGGGKGPRDTRVGCRSRHRGENSVRPRCRTAGT